MDIKLHRCNIKSELHFRISIDRKLTTTHCVSPYDSCHPKGHKLAVIRYWNNRVNTGDILSYDTETKTHNIFTILCNNQFNLNVLSQINWKKNLQKKKKNMYINDTGNNKFMTLLHMCA